MADSMSAEIAVFASSPLRGTRRSARRARSSGLSTSPLRPRMPALCCARCLQKGLAPEHDGGDPFFNPKVFGTGTRYFNLIAPFGTKFEFCQRLDKDYPPDSAEILGLEHIGLSARDFAASFRELRHTASGLSLRRSKTIRRAAVCSALCSTALRPLSCTALKEAQAFPEADSTRAPRLVFPRADAEASLRERNGACIRCEAAPKYDMVALGEALIDFVPGGQQESGKVSYQGAPGGAPSNVLAAASRLNMQTAFIGKVGNDVFGRLIRSTMERNGICTDGLCAARRSRPPWRLSLWTSAGISPSAFTGSIAPTVCSDPTSCR